MHTRTGSCIYLGGAFTNPHTYLTRFCLGRDASFDSVADAHELGPVNVMAAGVCQEIEQAAQENMILLHDIAKGWLRLVGSLRL